jgi:hypothetical protein
MSITIGAKWLCSEPCERVNAEFARVGIDAQQKERREAAEAKKRARKGLALVKQAQRKGIEIRRAVIEGVTLELGKPEAETPLTSLEEWRAKRRARQA